MMRIVLALTAMLIAAAVATVVVGASSWNRATKAAVAQLPEPSRGADVFSIAALDDLPEPAARYFRRVLREGQPIVQSAIATQEAEFFLNGAWRPLRATQQFVTSPPGFVWDARIAMAPLVSAFVRDAYVSGTGSMTASALGVYSIVNQAATPELNAGALQRFLGEAIWLPTALLPSSAVVWTSRDERSATVTLRDGANTVSLVFEFDPEGLVTSIAGDRFKENGGAYTLQPWRIRCGEYRERDGMVIPLQCEVAWIADGRLEPYWRGRITSITYRYNSLE
jgi:hypothetical protein